MSTPDSQSSEVSPLEAHVGYWLRYVSNHVSHAFKLKVESRDVTVAEWVVMRELLRLGTVNPSELAASLRMTRGTISKLMDRLINKKLATRQSVKGDQRFQKVSLTQAGRKLVPALATLADENDAAFFGHLSPRQREQLTDTLKEIACRSAMEDVPVN